MSNDEIKDLLAIFMESGVAEMEVKRGENALKLRRGYASSQAVEAPAPAFVVPAAAQTEPVPVASHAAHAAAPDPGANDHIVKSPIVGTFYEAPKPGDPAFVKVGDAVEVGQVLCIVESMKLMNEIESEWSGTVAARLMENGRPVEYGEALFAIRPR